MKIFGILSANDSDHSFLYLCLKLSTKSADQNNDLTIVHSNRNEFGPIVEFELSEECKYRLQKSADTKLLIQNCQNVDSVDECECIELDFLDTFEIEVEKSRKLTQFSKTADDLSFKFYLVLNFDQIPTCESIEIDKSLLEVFDRPNVELLNDWLFCHSHPNDNSSSSSSFSRVKPLILDHMEQCLHLLHNESNEILFESIANKDHSLYIKCEQKNFYTTTYEYESRANNNKCEVKFRNTMLISYHIFDSNGEIDRNLLKKYRMSFQIDWYQITDQLFHEFQQQIESNSQQLNLFYESNNVLHLFDENDQLKSLSFL